MDERRGEVRLAAPLDFETEMEHRLAVLVEDGEGRRGFAQMEVSDQKQIRHRDGSRIHLETSQS